MSVNIDQSRSFVSSQLKNENGDLLVQTSMSSTNDSSKSQIFIRSDERKSDLVTQCDNESQIIKQISSNEQECSSKECNDQTVCHHLRYCETKSITEKMDLWYLDMKKNLMNEFDKLRLQYIEEAQQNTLREKEIQVKEYVRLQDDIKLMREMLMRYEHTIDQKDQTENNLRKALDILSNKTVSYRQYYEWRVEYIERKHEKYSLLLAKKFYENKIKKKVLINWKIMIDREVRKRFEITHEKKTKTMFNQVHNEYETKCKQLELQLLNANEEITRLKMSKNVHDEIIKQAFMRGVCALNMEAMSVLFKDKHDSDTAIIHEQQTREYFKRKNDDTTDEQSFEEEIKITSSSTTDDEEKCLKYSSYRHTRPTHVYKEYSSTTIDPTRDGRFVRSNHHHHHHHHTTFPKHSSMTTNQPRHTNSNILLERNGHTDSNCP